MDRSSSGGRLWNRVSQVQGRGDGRAMASLPPFRSRAHLAMTAGMQGAGRRTGALGSLLCYATKGSDPASDALDEPSSSSSLLANPDEPAVQRADLFHLANPDDPAVRLLHSSLDLLHQKLDDMVSMKTSVKRLIWWTFCGVVMVICVVLAVGTVYNVAGGRSYIEAEMTRVTKTVFLTLANDAEVSTKLDELVIGRVDTTVAYLSSIATWYKWLFGK